LPPSPPWENSPLDIDVSLASKYSKSELIENPLTALSCKAEVSEILDRVSDISTLFYTDGSKDQSNRVGFGIYCPYLNMTHYARIPDGADIFTAEAEAISMTLDIIKRFFISSALIVTDSLSVLTALQYKSANPVIDNIISKTISAKFESVSITFMWVPSHIGIYGNEKADSLAKRALGADDASIIRVPLPVSAYYSNVKSFVLSSWGDEWRSSTHPLARDIRDPDFSSITFHDNPFINSIMYSMALNSPRLNYYLAKVIQCDPMCACRIEKEDINHFLFRCPIFSTQRNVLFRAMRVHDLRSTFCLRWLTDAGAELSQFLLSTGRF
jgi:ribonuclease HI